MKKEYQEYLNPTFINKIDNLSLRAKLVVEGFIIGMHKSPYHGFSVEFSEHRPYGFGDEIKYIDWKLWGKTDRFYIKQFEEETNLSCHLILDKSLSMDYGSNELTKFEYSKSICAALSYLMIKQQDAVGLTTFDDKIKKVIKPKSKTSQLNLLLKTMHNSSTGGETNISNLLHGLAESINKKGLIILISDLLDDEHKVMESLRHFRYKGHEIIVFHIVDPKEKDLDFNQNMNFIDLESNYNIIADSRLVKENYNKAFKKFSDYYKNECLRDKIDYNLVSTSESLDKTLLQYLIKRSQINK
ncbi:MAG: DUF58 domain-containing protein [Candidatus Marinimicrobia bacterium]|nr:DUF58 domain-containing protein [Candidatus Neomarinimicrobiota bacterium]|tara:strand:- start:142 stop:1041 length:900 start_codon:yes stop_codon:yes gene_type:complete